MQVSWHHFIFKDGEMVFGMKVNPLDLIDFDENPLDLIKSDDVIGGDYNHNQDDDDALVVR